MSAHPSDASQHVKQLEEQLLALEKKLGSLHATDVNSLRRAYRTLAQHVTALELESRHIPNLLSQLETRIVSPHIIAQEVRFQGSLTVHFYAR